ncbi:MAG: hypothetical protein CMC13_12330 [Flavobacteriaceae bacterium]|nr:hypothetical protein [Flavobacteriaceae bacterium]|tara:strand:+ start:665 stop:1036 length:372 start_codon:yes stop_codon:yes gene_type:complete
MNNDIHTIKEIIKHPTSELLQVKIGKLVRTTLPIILFYSLITELEVKKLQQDEYCKLTLDMNYPILKKVDPNISILENRTVNGHTRYYSKPVKFIDDNYLISSEWYERNLEYYVRWLKRKVNI